MHSHIMLYVIHHIIYFHHNIHITYADTMVKPATRQTNSEPDIIWDFSQVSSVFRHYEIGVFSTPAVESPGMFSGSNASITHRVFTFISCL